MMKLGLIRCLQTEDMGRQNDIVYFFGKEIIK